MAKIYTDRLITSIDVGTTKICVLIAQQLEDERVEIIGVGKSPTNGLKKGVVVDVAKTIVSIKNAIKEAELMAGVSIESASIGISGAHINSLNSHGVVPIKNGEIRPYDIDNALAAAKAIPIPEGQQILHVLPQYFVIDGQEKVHDPVGMHGIRLEVQAHIILGAIASVQNLIKCCESAGVKVQDIILEQLASGHAVLSKDERELGVAVLDIGGGTTDLAVYQNGSIRHTKVIPVAGDHFTNDIAIGLRTTIKDAERIKKEHGLTCKELLSVDQELEIKTIEGTDIQKIKLSDLVKIVEPRTQELLVLVEEEILKNHLQSFITTGIVLTGGGSLLNGIKTLGENIFNMPVRVGHPHIEFDLPASLHSPIYATGYGMLIYALKKKNNKTMSSLNGPLVARVFERMKLWVLDFF